MINPSDSTSVVKEQIEDAVSLAGYSAPTSWADATDKINGTADQFERDQIADGMNGGLARDRINALFGGPVWAPEGARLTIHFAANKAWTRNNAVTDSVDAVNLTRAGSVLMLGSNGYESFASGELARIDGIGAQVAPARVNKCTNYNANPVDLTGVVKAGDVAATLTVVDDVAALAAVGLANICNSGKVYKLDNSSGTADAFVTIIGAVGNLNPHTTSIYWRGSGAGRARISGVAGVANIPVPSAYTREAITQTPAGANGQMIVVATPGSIVYFILNQLEEGSYASPPIITSGAAVSRPGDILSDSVTDGGRAFVFECTILGRDAAGRWVLEWSNGVNSQNRHLVTMNTAGTVFNLEGTIGGSFAPGSTVSVPNVIGHWFLYGTTGTVPRLGILGVADGAAGSMTALQAPIAKVGFLGNGRDTLNNPLGYPHRFTERPVTDFATPADAFAWAKSIAQGWAS